MRVSSQSSPYVRVNVTATLPDGSAINPTVDTVQFAFLPEGTNPSGGTTWRTGSWDESGAGYTARFQIGPLGTALDVGDYVVWLKVVDNPETLVQPANGGILSIF